jgi:hypothetical protein
MSARSIPDNHRIVVAGGEDGNWSRVVQISKVMTHSRVLTAEIEASVQRGRRETKIVPTNGTSLQTLAMLINSLQNGSPTSAPSDFVELLNLCHALWEYECNPQLFANIAAVRRDSLWPAQARLGSRAASWAFIALVFGWRDEFAAATAELIYDFSTEIHVVGSEDVPIAGLRSRSRENEPTFFQDANDRGQYLKFVNII